MNNVVPTYEKPSWSQPADYLKIALERAQREHDLLMNRTNMFLTYHSILMAGFALGSSSAVVLGVPILGLLTSLIWLYVAERSLRTAQYFWGKVLEIELQFEPRHRLFTEFFEWRTRSRFPVIGFSVSVYVARVLPILWAASWIVAAWMRLRSST
jgi:hypothetical protein